MHINHVDNTPLRQNRGFDQRIYFLNRNFLLCKQHGIEVNLLIEIAKHPLTGAIGFGQCRLHRFAHLAVWLHIGRDAV